LDVTDPAQVQRAAEKVGSLDLLFNNAGVALPAELSDRAALERHLAVNLFGTWAVTEAFLPLLTRTGGAVADVVSVAALAAVPVFPLLDLEGGRVLALAVLRALFAGRGASVHAVMAGPIDTDMVRDLDIPKTSPEAVARGIFDGVERGEEEIFPDPMSEKMAESWRTGAAKALERQNAALIAAEPAVA
jgi:NAD(P)-dependent dehydrogenase (short-subunit alcohol dehydrogenase family)